MRNIKVSFFGMLTHAAELSGTQTMGLGAPVFHYLLEAALFFAHLSLHRKSALQVQGIMAAQ